MEIGGRRGSVSNENLKMMSEIYTPASKNTALSVAYDPRSARIVARDKGAGWSILVFDINDGRLLPSVVPVANRQSQERADPPRVGKRPRDRLPPCKRCNPDGPSLESENVNRVARACRIIEESEEEPPLEELAAAVGRSPSNFHRLFKATTGVDAQGLCWSAPRQESAQKAHLKRHRHGGDLRCRLQFQRAVLREIHPHVGHDATAVSHRRDE
jgi:AraC-like DNA-binding protein